MSMDFDLVIRGGTIADGTGAALREGDVAIKDGRIAALGSVPGSGAEEIDARGKLVTPGFVDVHTHYDGQLTWADRMTPSSSHGVTTIVTGNCGVGFAPCRPQDRGDMIRLMEGVEDIPEVVMAAGLPWNWETFPEFLDALDARPHDVDYAVLLPHSPMRVYTMGQRAIDLEPATAEDRRRMREITREAITAGAIGVATSRNVYHKTSDGKPVPCFKSEEEELREIALGMTDAGRGTLQAVLITEDQCLEDFERFHRIAKAAGRPLTYTLLSTNEAPDLWQDVLRSVERDRLAGQMITPQVFNRPVGVIFGLDSNFSPFVMHPYYNEHLAGLSFEQRVAEMRKPEVKAALLADTPEMEGMLANAVRDFGQLYAMEHPMDYEPERAKSVEGLAAARGVSPYEVLYDMVMAEEGRGKVMLASMNYSQHNLDHARAMLDRDDTVLALGDGGAHCGIICDASYTTTALMLWARDRTRGARIPLEKVVKKLTSETADLYGFKDRGRLAIGLKADLNVIDFDNLTLGPPEVIHDLPGGGSRLVQPPKGFEATILSGTVTQRGGVSTDALPGRLIRSGTLH
ncbi:MAG TPA: amidohydrolase family protein [Novosphingobium sp.]|nr:amidohydrolase family protein [Novosphingobium sp.]